MDQIREKREAPPAAAPVPLLGPYLLVNTYLLARRYRGDRAGGRHRGILIGVARAGQHRQAIARLRQPARRRRPCRVQ